MAVLGLLRVRCIACMDVLQAELTYSCQTHGVNWQWSGPRPSLTDAGRN